MKTRRRKTTKAKPTDVQTPARRGHSSVVDLQQKLRRQARELEEAREEQAAAAEVLRIISSSPGELEPVFQAILEKATRLCEAKLGNLWLREGTKFRIVAIHGGSQEYRDYLFDEPLVLPDEQSVMARIARNREIVHVDDISTAPTYGMRMRIATIEIAKAHTLLGLPMLKDQEVVGIIAIYRQEVRAFTDRQIELVKNFAAQAVIAIENARLFGEVQTKTRDLEESLQQQTATADVLKIISRSAFDLDTVLETLISTATRLCNCGPKGGQIFRREGDVYRYAASQMNVDPDYLRHEQTAEIKPGRGTLIGRVALSKRTVMITDAWSDPEYEEKDAAQTGNVRAMLGVPLLRDGEPIGAFALARSEPIAFTEREVELVTSFADQAVIAIENARLFNEVQARTQEVTETLEYQTATSDVLNVISRSPNDLQPVMDTIVQTARRLCEAEYALMLHLADDGSYRIVAHSNASKGMFDWMQFNPVTAGDGSAVGIVAATKQTVHLPDSLADPRFTDLRRQQVSKARTMLGVPLLREGDVIGVIFLARTEVKPFGEKQIEIVTSFADQAVIAIQNVRLFEEVQARTKELATSLDDLRAAQDRLVQTEKLASLGQLTAGIAHEIKNPLNFVNNFSALSAELVAEMRDVLANTSLDTATREELDQLAQMLKGNLEKVVQHGKRADSIVKNMLQHSREGSGEHRPADINAIVEESLNLAYHGARAEKAGFSISFQRNLDSSVGMADIYPQEITRVLLNIISNGFYAATKRKAEVGDGFEPVLSAKTKNLGDKVEIRIRDNGTGIPDEVKKKIFNPFFTTKPSGEGTGLGLSMSHDIIVRQHGGSIDFETEPGLFTEFKIVLPRTSQR